MRRNSDNNWGKLNEKEVGVAHSLQIDPGQVLDQQEASKQCRRSCQWCQSSLLKADLLPHLYQRQHQNQHLIMQHVMLENWGEKGEERIRGRGELCVKITLFVSPRCAPM